MHKISDMPFARYRLFRELERVVVMVLIALATSAANSERVNAQGSSTAKGKPPIASGGALTSSTVASAVAVDHSIYDALLRRFVDHGHVNYEGFALDTLFPRYLASLDRINPAVLDADERLAFWLNVYNAFTIQRVVASRETGSIRNIDKSLGFLRLKGPWSAPFVRAGQRTLTLDDVAHHILRREFSDPRIHFAMVYAALGSPPLRSEAYRGASLNAQLDDQGRRFLRASPSQNRLEPVRRMHLLVLSPIFTYYRADFGATRADLGRFLARWFDPADKEWLERGAFQTVSSTFDWTLNSQKKAEEVARRPGARVDSAARTVAEPPPRK